MRPNVHISQNPLDPVQQVVTFDPPVASWSFKGRALPELWLELTQATSALLFEHKDEMFDEELQKKLRARILTVVLYWVAQKWVDIPNTTVDPAAAAHLDS